MILPFQKLHSHWLSGQPTTTTRQKEQSSPVFIGLSLTLISTHLLPTDSVPYPSVPVEVYRQIAENQIKKTIAPRLFLPHEVVDALSIVTDSCVESTPFPDVVSQVVTCRIAAKFEIETAYGLVGPGFFPSPSGRVPAA